MAKTKKQTQKEILQKEFAEKVVELKKEKSKEELLKIVSVQPLNHELNDFLAARKALDELKVPYSRSFK